MINFAEIYRQLLMHIKYMTTILHVTLHEATLFWWGREVIETEKSRSTSIQLVGIALLLLPFLNKAPDCTIIFLFHI